MIQFLSRKLPSFFIIGAQKAGTTSLWHYLNQHPDLYASRFKETNYFFTSKSNHQQKFSVFFPRRVLWKNSQHTFDSSAGYFHFRHIPERIHQYDKNSKLILILRNPTQRAISALSMYRTFYQVKNKNQFYHLDNIYKHYFNLLPTPAISSIDQFYETAIHKSDEEILLGEIENLKKDSSLDLEPGLIQKGIYVEQLKSYLEYFSSDQIFIVESEQLSFNPLDALHAITEFLGVKRIDWESIDLKKKNVGKGKSEFDLDVIKKIDNFYKPYNQSLYSLTGKKYDW